jgi:hypothetical protein
MEPGNSHALNPLIEQTAKKRRAEVVGPRRAHRRRMDHRPHYCRLVETRRGQRSNAARPARLARPGQGVNWLRAPDGSFMAVSRLYWTKDDALNGAWKQPHVEKLP